jgi:hypothetical protein
MMKQTVIMKLTGIMGGFMRKEYVYRKHLRILNKLSFIVLLSISGLLIALAIVLNLVVEDGEGRITALTILGILAAVLAIEAFLLRYFFGRFAKVKITLDEEGITYVNYKGTNQFPYESIKYLEFPSVKYLGGWIKIKTNDQSIRLTVVVHNIQSLIKELKEQLDKRGMEVYHEKKLWNFFKTAMYSDASWERLYRIFWKLIFTFVGFFGLSVLIFSIVGKFDLIPGEFYLVLLIVFVPYLIAEMKFVKRMNKQLTEQVYELVPNDVCYENQVFKKMYVIGILIYLIQLILCLIFF